MDSKIIIVVAVIAIIAIMFASGVAKFSLRANIAQFSETEDGMKTIDEIIPDDCKDSLNAVSEYDMCELKEVFRDTAPGVEEWVLTCECWDVVDSIEDLPALFTGEDI